MWIFKIRILIIHIHVINCIIYVHIFQFISEDGKMLKNCYNKLLSMLASINELCIFQMQRRNTSLRIFYISFISQNDLWNIEDCLNKTYSYELFSHDKLYVSEATLNIDQKFNFVVKLYSFELLDSGRTIYKIKIIKTSFG